MVLAAVILVVIRRKKRRKREWTIFDLLIMSINNLRRRKLRTGLTVLGVVIGTASIVVMVSGNRIEGKYRGIYASFGSLTRIQISSGYGNQSEDDYLVDATVTKLAKIPM